MDGSVEQVVFLGDAVDCRVHVGEVSLVSRQHPSVLVERGDSVKVQLPPELCTLVTDDGHRNLTAACPKEARELERICGAGARA